MADRYLHFTGTAPGRFLSSPPRLAPAMVRGAIASPGRARRLRRPGWTGRIRDDADALPKTRLVLTGARIDPGRLASYSRLCGFPSDPNGTVPLTYPHVLGLPLAMRLMTARQFPLPVLGLVHTWIEIGGQRALSVEERPEISVYAQSLVPHRRGVEVIIVTEARVAGEVVWHSRSAYLARHRDDDGRGDGRGDERGDEPGHGSRGPDSRGRHGRRVPAPAPTVAVAPDIPRPLPVSAEWRLPAELGRRYGAVSGDRNPIHLHPLTARPFGFPRAIAHGMWTFARCVAEAEGEVGTGTGTGTGTGGHGGHASSVRGEFRAPVPLPATVTYAARTGAEGSVAFQLRDGAGTRVHLTGELSRDPSSAPPP
ncbi:MaoC family dehydratase [Streptomyces sp. NPDC056937]|uniref:MaoC family dehydratase n=1 Tax=Streptomyces sp. NPDC056937 TaxID=3345969 RepID=UPI00363B84A6